MTQPPPTPVAQSTYQVRFEWAGAGAAAISGDVDAIVSVDALDPSHVDLGGSDVAVPVIRGGFANRTAVARWVLARQSAKGDRFTVAVIAAGGTHEDGSPRFAVEDLLAAGAVIDALAAVGIDFCSPEAAAASAAFTGLKGAIAHLSGASVTGRLMTADGRRAEIKPAVILDSSDEVVEHGGRAPQAEFSPGA